MIGYLINFYGWVKDQAAATLAVLILVMAVAFVALHYYPLTFEMRRSRTENYVRLDSVNCYVVSTTWTHDGAKLFVESNTIVSQVETEGEN